MMLSKKLFRQINIIALFAVLFASLAPSISYALTAKQGINSFVQEVCSSDGKVITIQVVTAKGKQLSTELDGDQIPSSKSVISHLNHCPFCSNPNVNTAIEPSALLIAALAHQAEKLDISLPITFSRFISLTPPAQAPPSL